MNWWAWFGVYIGSDKSSTYFHAARQNNHENVPTITSTRTYAARNMSTIIIAYFQILHWSGCGAVGFRSMVLDSASIAYSKSLLTGCDNDWIAHIHTVCVCVFCLGEDNEKKNPFAKKQVLFFIIGCQLLNRIWNSNASTQIVITKQICFRVFATHALSPPAHIQTKSTTLHTHTHSNICWKEWICLCLCLC